MAEELGQIKDSARTYFALSDLAQAQAWMGDIQAARKSVLLQSAKDTIRPVTDMTDGQPYALLRVAIVQIHAGDLAGARERFDSDTNQCRNIPLMRGPSGRLNQIAAGQIAAGDLDGALRSAEVMERGERAETLASVAAAQAVIGQREPARATLVKALEDAAQSASAASARPQTRPAVGTWGERDAPFRRSDPQAGHHPCNGWRC